MEVSLETVERSFFDGGCISTMTEFMLPFSVIDLTMEIMSLLVYRFKSDVKSSQV
ncbi:hypothetical protein AALP_AAs46475U000100 [Arabis alpina]|uniref:Uncharacterized protein n=1 Tax=Arabis alpina TaxID=50452 RepID=A0A087FYD5_ARAAL|nr:hypothetical protein AALP_AAs46475U000100 [Arabis alpina]